MFKWSEVVGQTDTLDLTWVRSVEDLNEITALASVGLVCLVTQPLTCVSSAPHQDGGRAEAAPSPRKRLTGQIRVSGDFLAGGDPETILEVTGVLFVLPPLVKIGFREVRLTGMLVVPRGSEGLLGDKLGSLTGYMVCYGYDAGLPRLFMGQESIGREFLELLPAPAPLVVTGKLTIAPDVTLDLLRAKVPEIVLMGQLVAPQHLLPLLQVLAVDKAGSIEALEQEDTLPEPFALPE